MVMIQAFNNFRRDFTPQTAEQKVRQLVASGKMNQQQLNTYQKMATEFQKMFNIR